MSKSKLLKQTLTTTKSSSPVPKVLLKNPEGNMLKAQLMSHYTSLYYMKGRKATLNRI